MKRGDLSREIRELLADCPLSGDAVARALNITPRKASVLLWILCSHGHVEKLGRHHQMNRVHQLTEKGRRYLEGQQKRGSKIQA